MMAEAETGVMQLQGKDTEDCRKPPGSRGGMEGSFPRAFGGSTALSTPWFWTSGLESCEGVNFYCFIPPGLWQFIMAALENRCTSLLPPYPSPLPALPTPSVRLVQEKVSLMGGNILHPLTIYLANQEPKCS